MTGGVDCAMLVALMAMALIYVLWDAHEAKNR